MEYLQADYLTDLITSIITDDHIQAFVEERNLRKN